MKRTLKILSLLGSLLYAAGCCESYDICLPETGSSNVSLEFSLLDDDGNHAFKSNISTVELGIYNDKGILVMMKHIPQTELDEFQGVKLTLDPGLYYVVSWGNIGGNAQCKSEDVQNSFGLHVTYTNSGSVTNTDKVFYAPKSGNRIRISDLSSAYRMTVDPVAGHAGVLEFTPAYRTVEVYIEGYEGTPLIELRNVPEGLEWFGMKWLADASDSKLVTTASKAATPVELKSVRYNYVAFDTFYFEEDNDIILNMIDNSTHEAVFAIALNEALKETGGFPTGTLISIVLKFTPAGVEVGIPHWESDEVDPGLGV